MGDTIRPGRASRSYRCKQCRAEVEFTVRLDIPTHRVVASGRCANGHEFCESWRPGGTPPPLPVDSGLEFTPVPRGKD